MRAGRYQPNQTPFIENSNSQSMDIDDNNTQHYQVSDEDIEHLLPLGFDDSELEIYFQQYNLHPDDFINTYLDIARSTPFNQTWQTYDDVLQSNDELNVERYPGRPYYKRDIAKDVLTFFDETMQQGGKRKHRRHKRKTRKTTRRHTKRKSSRRTRLRKYSRRRH